MRVGILLFTAIAIAALAVTPAGQSPARAPRLPAPGTDLSPDEALIRRALSLSSSGQPREAAAVWQTVGARQPVVALLAKREAARALIAVGDLGAAEGRLTELGATAPPDLLLRAAHAYRDAGQLDSAATLYRRARTAAGRSRDADEAALALASILEQQSRTSEALDVYRDLRQTFHHAVAFDVAHRSAKRIAERLQAPALSETAYDAIIARLAGIAAFRQAADMAVERLESHPSSAARTRVLARAIDHLYALRANDEARERASDFLERHNDSAEAHEVLITVFRLDVREGRTADVERRGRAIMAGQVPGTTLADRQGAARLLAEYLVSVGEPAKGRAVYDGLLSMTKARRARIDVLWRAAIASLLSNQRADAIALLKQALGLNPDSETQRAITFWLAYANAAADAKTARAQWQSLAIGHPFTYYGARAAARLGAPVRTPPLPFPTLTLPPAVFDHPEYKAAAMLSRAGMLGEAAASSRRLRLAFRPNTAVALLAARASHAAGDYTSASTIMSSYFGPYLQQPATGLPDDFWTLAYPRAYWTEVAAAAGRHKVDPLLMLGIARQESHFDRMARSPVGAIGLFQVMPYTAAELDPAFSTPTSMDRLTEPAVSAELAAQLLSSLQSRYDGALAPAIASYNADKERVDVWWKAASGLPEELFIDSIPYQQTRAYVRQVLTNYQMYRRSAR